LGKRIGKPRPPEHLLWLVLLVGAAGVTLALWLALHVDGQIGTRQPPADAPPDSGQIDTHQPPADTPPDSDPPGCATLRPMTTYTGFVDEYISPQIYDAATCRHSLSIEIDKYSPSYLGEAEKGGTFVAWADADLRTKPACEESWIRADLYRQLSDKWMLVSSKEGRGNWTNSPSTVGIGSCRPPFVGWHNAEDDPDVLIANSNYRIISTARTSPTGMTRRFRVYSQEDQQVPNGALTFYITGRVTLFNDSGDVFGGQLGVGSQFTGHYTYDPKTTDSNAATDVGDYKHGIAGYGMTVKIKTWTFRTNPANVNYLYEVVNRTTGGAMVMRSYNNVSGPSVTGIDHMSWQLDASSLRSNTPFVSDAILTQCPNLRLFTQSSGLTIDGHIRGTNWIIRGTVESCMQ
jgi:hypothetical protein